MLAKQLKLKQNNKKGGILGILSGTLDVILLGNLLTGKEAMRAGEGTLRVGEKQLDQLRSLIPPHPLTNFKTKHLLL